MACVCVCLLPRLHWPGFSPAVACLAQSQGLHCLYNQASLSLGRRTTMKLSVLVDVCFYADFSVPVLKLNANSLWEKCVILFFKNPTSLQFSWLVKWICNPNLTILHPYHCLSRPGWGERMETGHTCLSVCLSVFERRLPLNDVWQARQQRLWVLKDCFGVTEMWSVGSGRFIR